MKMFAMKFAFSVFLSYRQINFGERRAGILSVFSLWIINATARSRSGHLGTPHAL